MRAARVLVILLAISLAGVAPVSAHGPGSLHGSFEGAETAFVPGPAIPAGRCPVEAQWMLLAAGVATIDELGTFTWESAHCSWPVVPFEGGALGRLAAGRMTLTMDGSGDQLFVNYEGRWRFEGDLATGSGRAMVLQTFEFDGGTGQFEGASGGGKLNGPYASGVMTFRLHGELED